MKRFLDTNIITYFLKQNASVEIAIKQMAANDDEVSIPAIAYYETKRWLIATNAGHRADTFNNMMKLFPVIGMTMNTYNIAANVYVDLCKLGKVIEDADILIAASAIEHGAVLLTNNIAHFSRIKSLKSETVEGIGNRRIIWS